MAGKTVIPTGGDELNEMLGDPAKMKALFADPEGFKEFIGNYANSQMDAKTEIAAQVRDETQRVLAEFMKTNRKDAPAGFNPLDTDTKRARGNGKGAFYNKRAPGAKIDEAGLFGGDYTKFMQTISKRGQEGSVSYVTDQMRDDLGALKKIQNSYGTIVPADGGFLVPETLRSDIMTAVVAQALVRPLATVIPMETARVGVPYAENTSEVGGTSFGLTFYWAEEASTLTETQSKFGQTVLDANKLTGYVEVPSELPADGSAFGAFLDQSLPRGIAQAEDYSFFLGNGVGKPLGFMNNLATVIVAAAGQGANTLIWENITQMYARMLPSSLKTAVWIASIDTFPQLATMALSVGTGGSAIWLNNGTEGPPMTILGRPVLFTGNAPTLGTTGDISFVDMSYYLIGDRQTWQMTASDQFRFNQDKIAYRIIERLDGRPWIQSAITPANGGNPVSPFVQLSSTRT